PSLRPRSLHLAPSPAHRSGRGLGEGLADASVYPPHPDPRIKSGVRLLAPYRGRGRRSAASKGRGRQSRSYQPSGSPVFTGNLQANPVFQFTIIRKRRKCQWNVGGSLSPSTNAEEAPPIYALCTISHFPSPDGKEV